SIRIDRVFRQYHAAPGIAPVPNGEIRIKRSRGSQQRLVRRERGGDHFVGPNDRACQAPVKTSDETSGVRHIWPFPQSGLLHGTADLPASYQFSKIVDATTELAFRSRTASESEHC